MSDDEKCPCPPVRVSVECIIGWFTVALGLSVWQPNLSIPYYVLNGTGSARAWSVGLVSVGLGLIAAHKVGNRAIRLLMASMTFFAWATVIALIASNGSITPTGWYGFVVCAYLALVLYKYVTGSDGDGPT